jgi:molybdate-binding protein
VTRQQGLIARPGSRIRGVHDLTRPGVRFINRHMDVSVAQAVAEGRADAGFGLRAEATRFKLAFVPLAMERYFFACARSALRGAALKALLDVLRSPRFAAGVKRLPGYDATHSAVLEPLDAALTWVQKPRK